MSIRTYLVLAATLIGVNVFSQKGGLECYFSKATFNTSTGASYFETYLSVKGSKAVFVKKDDGKFQAKVNVEIEFKQHDSLKKADIYNLLSPESNDSANRPDFNVSKRYWLPHGDYMVSVKIEDKNAPGSKPLTLNGKVTIGYSTDTMSISDAERLLTYRKTENPGPLSKCGIDMEPYVDNYYPEELKTISFYAEIYNANKVFGNDRLDVRYFIESADIHVPLKEYLSDKVYKADTIIPVLAGFNIEKLPTGKYNLVLAVVNKKNEIVMSRGYEFFRNNPGSGMSMKDIAAVDVKGTFVASITNRDSLMDDVKCLKPVANADERDFIETVNGQTDYKLLQQFMYNFWVAHDPIDPAGEWAKYYVKVKYVNKNFGTYTRKGYETDRGRVYLQYGGAPDQRVVSGFTPSSYPYEIWEYYKLPDGQVDKKFVFYDPTVSTNEYELLHSTARGEIINPKWQIVLNSREGTFNNVDQNKVPDVYGENTLDDFSNPR
jgi:GWxTD domain-containing protein